MIRVLHIQETMGSGGVERLRLSLSKLLDKDKYELKIICTHTGGSIKEEIEKEGTEVVGYNFIINVEKSRYVKEKSKIPVSVSFDGGISRWSGLLDIALDGGFVVKPSNGWYSKVDEDGVIEDKKYRIKETDTPAFWLPILKSKKFQKFVSDKYQIASGEIMQGGNDNIFDEIETMNGAE
jgi:hypothetical protein